MLHTCSFPFCFNFQMHIFSHFVINSQYTFLALLKMCHVCFCKFCMLYVFSLSHVPIWKWTDSTGQLLAPLSWRVQSFRRLNPNLPQLAHRLSRPEAVTTTVPWMECVTFPFFVCWRSLKQCASGLSSFLLLGNCALGSQAWQQSVASTLDTYLVIEDLSPGSPYQFRVSASNPWGISLPSEPSEFVRLPEYGESQPCPVPQAIQTRHLADCHILTGTGCPLAVSIGHWARGDVDLLVGFCQVAFQRPHKGCFRKVQGSS